MMGFIRRFLYRRGFRPKPGSIFFSPSLDWHYKMIEAMKYVDETYAKVKPAWDNYMMGLPDVKLHIKGEIEE